MSSTEIILLGINVLEAIALVFVIWRSRTWKKKIQSGFTSSIIIEEKLDMNYQHESWKADEETLDRFSNRMNKLSH